jgi:hypothetical protein
MCSVRASKQTATFTLYTINRLVLCNRGRKCLLRGRGQLKCDGTRAETRFRLSAKRTSPFKLWGASVQSTTGSRGVRISGSNARHTMFRGSAKGTDYPLHSPVSPSLPLPFVTGCHPISTGLYALDTPCSEVVRRVLVTHSILQFPLHFPSRASPCVITFQLDSTRLVLI